MRKLFFFAVFFLCGGTAWATACDNSTIGSYTCVQQCNVEAVATSVNCAMSGNVTSGNLVVAFASRITNAATLSISGCSPVSFTAPQSQATVASGEIQMWYGTASSTGACTITVTSTAGGKALNAEAMEISGSTGVIDGSTLGTASKSGTTLTANASITTTVNGDLVVAWWSDMSNSSGCTYTAASGYTMMAHNTSVNCPGTEGQTQSSAGSIQPTITTSVSAADAFGDGVMAFKPTGGGGCTAPKGQLPLVGVGNCAG